jgi:hypothetical protein
MADPWFSIIALTLIAVSNTHLIPRDGHQAVDGLDTPSDAHGPTSPAQADTLRPV